MRPRINCILRGLPQHLARLARTGSLMNVPSKNVLVNKVDSYDLELVTTKIIKQALTDLKFPSLAVDVTKIFKRHDLPPCVSPEFLNSYSNIWCIEYLSLRAIRLKLCLRDFANKAKSIEKSVGQN